MNFPNLFFLLLIGVFAFVNCSEDLKQQVSDTRPIEEKTNLNHRFARGMAKRSWSFSHGHHGMWGHHHHHHFFPHFGGGYGYGHGGWGFGK